MADTVDGIWVQGGMQILKTRYKIFKIPHPYSTKEVDLVTGKLTLPKLYVCTGVCMYV